MKTSEIKWIKVTIPCRPEAAEILQAVLFDMGITGAEEKSESVVGYFTANRTIESLTSDLSARLDVLQLSGVIDTITFEEIFHQNWGETWNRFFKPIRISDRLVVKPPWLDWTGPEPVVIDIMPKMAFGTGTHETTQLCLEMMEPLITQGCRVLDVGTGSGILSIAAIRLGAASATGVDVDEDSVANAIENAEQNSVAERIQFHIGSVDCISEGTFDLVLANIQRSILIPLIPALKQKLEPGSNLIFSGILDHESEEFASHLRKNGLTVLQAQQKGEWVAFDTQLKI